MECGLKGTDVNRTCHECHLKSRVQSHYAMLRKASGFKNKMFSGVSELVEDDLKHEEEKPSETEK